MKFLFSTLIGIFCLSITYGQSISSYQYRQVPEDKVDMFIYRETTYWKKVAQKAIDDGKMTFWALLEKVGGVDLPNSSNYLFINSFDDIDAGGVWDPTAVFPDVPMDQMETYSFTTTTSQIFVHDENWVDDAGATPSKDYNYVVINYWDTSDADAWIKGENDHWAPFIKSEMAKPATSQVAWGNARVLAPQGVDFHATTLSFDMFPTLQSALMPKWDDNAQFPMDALSDMQKTLRSPRVLNVYRIVAVATKGD